MKKTILVTAIALALGYGSSAKALHEGDLNPAVQPISITKMNFGGSYDVSGTLNPNGIGSVHSVDNFVGQPWVMDQQNWFETRGNQLTWSGTGTLFDNSNAYDDFTYNFILSSNQVAVGTFWDWNGNNNIPILTIYDCPQVGIGACVGESLPMATAPFPGSTPQFVGVAAEAVPVPASIWLMGSGLVGLVGLARRKRKT